MPICNPVAYSKNQRYCWVNLNRIFDKSLQWDSVEYSYRDYIMELIDAADVVLDLHTNHHGDEPFVFVDRESEEDEVLWAKSLKLSTYIYWWKDVYKNNWWTTSEYAHKNWKISLTVECGEHNSPYASARWVSYIVDTLKFFGLLSWESTNLSSSASHIRIKEIVYKWSIDWFTMKKNAKHWDEIVYKWESGVLLLPYHEAKHWDEWFYFWKYIN